jgi:hypothetical protein
LATRAWHDDPVDREKAMTELLEAMADVGDEAEERRLLRVAAAMYTAMQVPGVKQRDLVAETGLSRETIRRYVEDEKIRRGEIAPTRRYLAEQAKKNRADDQGAGHGQAQ